jgi:hypothetical protein
MADKPDGCDTKADRYYKWCRWLGPIGAIIKLAWEALSH